MKKSNTYAKNGAVITGLVNGTISIFHQLDEMEKNPEIKFDFWRMTGAIIKGAALGGLGGYAIGSYLDYQNNLIRPVNTSPILKCMVKDISLDKTDQFYQEYHRQSQLLSDRIYKHYGSRLKSRPVYYGSSVKGTALKDTHDIDIALNFWHNSFSSLDDIYDDLWSLFSSFKQEGLITKMRLQNNSIGVFIDVYGKSLKIDFVPIQVTKRKASSGYLRVNRQSFFSNNFTIKKTDVGTLTSVNFTRGQTEVIVLLKKWKKQKGVPIKSHLLEKLVCRAYEETLGIKTQPLAKRVVGVSKFISQNFYSMRMVSAENTNNILTDLDLDVKTEIVNAFEELISQYEYQPNSIIEVFQ